MQRWANDDLRSLNAQIEFVLRDALRRAGRSPRPGAETPPSDAGNAPPSRRGRQPGDRKPGDCRIRAAPCRYKKACRCTCLPPCPSRPLLKWAGGKRQLIPAIGHHYPDRSTATSSRSSEAARCSSTCSRRGGSTAGRSRLADLNPDLIGCYRALRDETGAVIDALARLQREHRTARRRLLLRRAGPPVQPAARGAGHGVAEEREARPSPTARLWRRC